MKIACVALILAGLWCSTASPESTYNPVDQLPISKVVLYKHGLGYFEREGKVHGDVMLNFAFREDQMKDILTSFFAVDLGKGKISSIRYETGNPVARQLQEIMIKAPDEAVLSQFMLQLKGANLRLKAAGESIEGRVLGIEPVTEVISNVSIKKGYRLALLTQSGSIRSVDLFAISEFALTDESLQNELRRSLDVSLNAKRTDRKQLTVSAIGDGERSLRMGYLTEMPVWKCSYRVIFDDKAKGADALLQGWALAENNTEEDWKNVKITFVAGNPISFMMDLYSPYYMKRPLVPIPGLQEAGLDWEKLSSPDMTDEPPHMATKKEKSAAAPMMAMERPGAAQSKDRSNRRNPSTVAQSVGKLEEDISRSLGDILSTGYTAQVDTAKLGELFSYEPKERISIPRGQAAMVSILSQALSGKRVIYYKADFSPRPLNAFVLQNSSNLTLEAGPVTFFDGSASLGKGILTAAVPPGSQEVIPYAIDVTVDIVSQEKSRKDPYVRARLVDGILTLTSGETLTNSWKIINRGKEPHILWLHQPKNSAYRLSRPEKPLKEVDRHYRFEIPLKAGETVDFAVEEKRDISETVSLAKCNEEQIRFYISQPALSKAAKAFMKEIGDMMAKRASLQRETTELNQQTKRLSDEQARIRSNLQSLTSNQPKELELRGKWVASLSANENQLSECRGKLDEAGAQILKMDESLARKIKDFRDE